MFDDLVPDMHSNKTPYLLTYLLGVLKEKPSMFIINTTFL